MADMRYLATVVGILLVVGLFSFVPVAQSGPGGAEPQFRAFWVDSFNPGLYNEAEIDRLVADTKAANMNAIIAQIVRRGDCLCNRSIMPRMETDIDPYPFDPLQTLIEKAHAAGIEVHAWFNTTIMWVTDSPPVDPSHVFYAHGITARGRDNWVMLRRDGANKGSNLYFFDPGHPDAADYIVKMFLSVVRNYDVDGINFDYVRYPDYNLGLNIPSWGYNPTAVARFQTITGRSDVPEPTDSQWTDWRREQVTNIVRRVYLESMIIKPNIRVSADTVTYGDIQNTEAAWTETRPYREVLQDWHGWMKEGILDLNIPMNYRYERTNGSGSNHARSTFEEWNDFVKDHQYNRQAAIGTALWLNPIGDIVTQIRKALAPSSAGNRPRGWVGFSYRDPDVITHDQRRSSEEGRLQLSRALTQPTSYDPMSTVGRAPLPPVFARPVPTPSMPWKALPTKGHLIGSVKTVEGKAADQYVVSVSKVATKTQVASRRTNGSGWFGFVDLSPGEYQVSVMASGDTGATTVVDVVAGQVTPVELILLPVDRTPDRKNEMR
jgi:uncharacterized lipoprotein YddW (UPF0748 family)